MGLVRRPELYSKDVISSGSLPAPHPDSHSSQGPHPHIFNPPPYLKKIPPLVKNDCFFISGQATFSVRQATLTLRKAKRLFNSLCLFMFPWGLWGRTLGSRPGELC